ncbi:TRIM3 [Branchiostoma lanceolatum]|uniref:TRIM3 protein n=1 Tax=Branchiostoma lanceolatum TaxID=7740 RepID=A0A8J9YLI8_BRALA|nr:TRIM3 [Branchiostoma lanceolatum]
MPIRSDDSNVAGIRHPTGGLRPNPQKSRDPNPMYKQRVTNPDQMGPQNVQNYISPVYQDDTTAREPSCPPEPAFTEPSNKGGDNAQPCAATNQEEDKTTLGPADNDDSDSIQSYAAANEAGAVSTRTPASNSRTDDCSTCIRPHAVANRESCVPASSTANSDGMPYTQPHAVANQEGCVPASSTVNSDGVPDIQPHAVANQEGCVPASSTVNSDGVPDIQPHAVANQEGCVPASSTVNSDGVPDIQPNAVANREGCVPASSTVNSDGMPYTQPHAVANQEGCVPSSSTADSDGVPDIQPYAVANQEDGVLACSPCIHPYAVAYQEDDNDDTPSIKPYAVRFEDKGDDDRDLSSKSDAAADNGQSIDDVNIIPYAVAYKSQDDTATVEEVQAGQASNTCNDLSFDSSGRGSSKHEPDSQPTDGTLPDPPGARVQVRNVLVPNPIYHELRTRIAQVVTLATIIMADDVSVSTARTINDSRSETTPVSNSSRGATFPTPSNSSILPASSESYRGATLSATSESYQGATLSTTSNSSQQDNYSGVSERIVFGGGGTEPGRFRSNHGVVVSADKEIFVTDLYNKRVQVFDMNGDFVRLFPTVVPNDDEMFPADVTIDKDGLLWVVGKLLVSLAQVVRYTRGGQPLLAFSVPQRAWFAKIAVDIRHNTVIVEANDEIFHFRLNGSLNGRFEKRDRYMKIGYIALDKERNLLATDYADPGVHVYNRSGHWLFKFGAYGVSEGQLRSPHGICVDSTSGHVIVANSRNRRIDMFTGRGEFVRTVVSITEPWDLALGPDGELLVTNVHNNSVTIFPRRIVFPHE